MIQAKTIVPLLFAAAFMAACQGPSENAEEKSYTVHLQCEAEDPQQNAVFAIVNQNKVKLASINLCDSISPSSYEDFDIPAAALSAVGGQWAGVGEYFYAIEEGSAIIFYEGWMEEGQEEDNFHYHKTGTFADGQFNLQMPLKKEELVGTYALSREAGSHILFVGLKGDTLVAEYFQMDGILPPVNQLNILMTSLERKAASPLKINPNTLNFTSGLGNGKFVNMKDSEAVLLLGKGEGGHPLRLDKILSEDYSIPVQ